MKREERREALFESKSNTELETQLIVAPSASHTTRNSRDMVNFNFK